MALNNDDFPALPKPAMATLGVISNFLRARWSASSMETSFTDGVFMRYLYATL
jgi:hypothetical protein